MKHKNAMRKNKIVKFEYKRMLIHKNRYNEFR